VKISFKYAIAAVIVGGLFVVTLLVGAPLVLGAAKWATRAPDPTEAEVCVHLKTLGLDVPECPTWLESARADLDDLYDNRLRCYNAAATIAIAKTCDNDVELSSEKWD
jgi:hypothetical protein